MTASPTRWRRTASPTSTTRPVSSFRAAPRKGNPPLGREDRAQRARRNRGAARLSSRSMSHRIHGIHGIHGARGRSLPTPSRAPTLLAAGLAAAAASSSAATALADTVQGSRSEALVEKTHRIELRLDRGSAELVVRRTIHNGGPRHDQATFMMDLPAGAVATGLGTLGTRDGQPFWFRGELMEAEAAATKYRELTGIGGYYPKDPALLSWRSQKLLALQVFPCAPGQPKTVEYTLRMPTAYRGGRHHVALPRLGTPDVPPELVVSSVHAEDRLFVDGAPVASGGHFKLTRDEIDVALAPPAARPVDGALASVPIAPGRELVQFHLDAPARLSKLPRGARVVVLLDASWSIAEADGAAGVAAARAYLGHLPDARVEVLTFDREVRGRHGKLVPAARALADLEGLTLDRRNGSRLDDALARADALLAAAPPGFPRRILAITDLRTRSTLTPERLGAVVKSGALVHVGVAGEGAPAVARDDESPWAAAVRATGGLVWIAAGTAAADDAPAMSRVYEEWARPVRIEKLAVKAAGVPEGELDFGVELLEGEGVEHRRVNAAAVPEVELTGELWARPFRKVLRPDAAHGRLWSALVFGSELVHDLAEPEMAALAVRGGAVSPVTSYLAVEPGVRPSTEGLDWSGTGEGGGGFGEGIGLGSIGTIGHGGGSYAEPFLRDALSAAFRGCPAGAKAATVTLETTLSEVVDVPRVALAGGPDAAVERCLEEAAWALALPSRFSDPWASHEVKIAR